MRVCSFESRRANEMKSLIERFGGQATIAPSMQEVPLDHNPLAFAFGEQLAAGAIPTIIFLTGVGTRALLELLETRWPRAEIVSWFNARRTIVRGPKPVPVLREYDIHIDLRAAEPNTWHDVVTLLDETPVPVAGEVLAIQEYGKLSVDLAAAIEARGGTAVSVPVYRWALPDDLGPLEAAIRGLLADQFDIVMFTSAQQMRHVALVAAQLGCEAECLAALRRTRIASIGPTCSETLAEFELPVWREPTHPKMGHLVKESLSTPGE